MNISRISYLLREISCENIGKKIYLKVLKSFKLGKKRG